VGLTLAPASTQTVTVAYATVNGRADPTDYVEASGVLTFAPGATMLRLPIEIKADGLDEPDEMFFVDLSGATNATISRARGTLSIVDDDRASPRLVDAFVDARWSVHRRYTRVTRFVIHALAGAEVRVRCTGGGCRRPAARLAGAKLAPARSWTCGSKPTH
jgi:Calx-beta domain